MSRPKEEENKLSDNDVKVYARQLVGVALDEWLRAGRFDMDLALFNVENQKRIKSELKKLKRTLSAVWQPEEKPNGMKKEEKGQEE